MAHLKKKAYNVIYIPHNVRTYMHAYIHAYIHTYMNMYTLSVYGT